MNGPSATGSGIEKKPDGVKESIHLLLIGNEEGIKFYCIPNPRADLLVAMDLLHGTTVGATEYSEGQDAAFDMLFGKSVATPDSASHVAGYVEGLAETPVEQVRNLCPDKICVIFYPM